jgi:alpha-tubulin suppressor-like RCC1 family protein
MKSNKNHSLKFFTSTIVAVAALGLVSIRAIATPTCVPLPTGLTDLWSGEGSAADAVGTNNGTLTGGVTYGTAKVAQGFHFDGTGSVSFGNSVGNFRTNDYTIEFWVRTTSTDAMDAIMEKWTGCGDPSKFVIRMGYPGELNGHLSAEQGENEAYSYSRVVTTKALNDGVFHHVALVRQSTNFTFYIDGTFDVTSPANAVANINNPANFVVGNSVCVNWDGTATFKGDLDEISVYNRALNANEIGAIYAAGSAGKCPAADTLAGPIYNPANGHCYYLLATNSWTASEAIAVNLGGHLVTINDASEQTWVFNTFSTYGGTNRQLWIGLNDLAQKGTYVWASGESLTYSNWYPGEPNNFGAGEDYGMIFPAPDSRAGYWNDADNIASVNATGLAATPIYGVVEVTSCGVTPPSINSQPKNQSVNAGTTATFTVSAGGTPTLSYQWFFNNNTLLTNATSATLTLNNVQVGQAGGYSVVVTNFYGAVTSAVATLTVNPPVCTSAPSGLVGWWQGEGNGNDSASTNNGILDGSVSFVSGLVGQAFSFNGANADLHVPASTNLNVGVSSGLTIEGWINPTDVSAQRPIAEWYTAGYGAHFWLAVPVASGGAGPGSLYANLIDTSTVDHKIFSAASLIKTNIYQHVAVTYDKSSGVAVIYLNGTLVKQSTLGTFTPKTSADLNFGYRPGGSASGTRFVGKMDELSLYNRALSSNEIAAIYAAGSAGKCTSASVPAAAILAGPISNPANGHCYYLLQTNTWTGAEASAVALGGHLVTINDAAEQTWVYNTFATYGGTNRNALWLGYYDPSRDTNGLAHVTNFVWASGEPVTYTHWSSGEPNNYGVGEYYGAMMTPPDSRASYWLDMDNIASINATGQGGSPVYGVVEVPGCANACTPAPTNLVAWWQAEGNANDSAGTNQGTLVGGVGFTNGEANQAFNFVYGLNQCVKIPYNSSLIKSNYSVEAWIKPTAQVNSPYNAAVIFEEPFGAPQLVVRKGTSGVLVAFFFSTSPSSPLYQVVSTNEIPLGQISHVAGTWDGTVLRLYINGILNNQNTPGTSPVTSGYPFYIGGMYDINSQYFNGWIDEVSLYGSALSATEIQSIYNSGSFGKCALPPNTGTPTNLFGGMVVEWGDNTYGQTNVPVGLTNVTAIAAGGGHTLALKRDGTVVAWGSNATYGQANVPAGLSNVMAIAAGGATSWAVKSNGKVVGWGENTYNQMITIPSGLSNVTAIAAGVGHTVALKSNGTVVGWGYNGNGQTTIPAGLTNATAIAAGWYFSVALKSNGTVAVWGANGDSQLNIPPGLTNVTAIAAGRAHIVALKGDGTVVAWGYPSDDYGQMTIPAGLTNVTAIAAGQWHTVALKSDGTLVAWGDNSVSETTIPAGLGRVMAIAAGGNNTVALVATVTRLPAIAIANQPANQSVFVGQTAAFNVTATGSQPISYQWRKGGNSLSGATNSSYNIVSAVAGDAGIYSVVVSNASGSVTSSNAVLTVNLPVCTPAPANLAAWWSAEGNANDSDGTNQGTLVGGVGFTNGIHGQAFVFNGTNGYVNVPSSPAIKMTGPFTAEAWVNYSRTSGVGNNSVMVMAKGIDASTSLDWGMGISPAKKLRPHAQIGSSWVFFDCASTLNTGVWYHVAMVYNGTNLQGYVNGVLDGSQTVSGTLQATDYPLRIGTYASGYQPWFFPGQVDELALYNRALSATEIQSIYNSVALGKCALSPTIVTQPANQSVIVGQTAAFNVAATGSQPLSYQWSLNGTNLTGATNATLTVPNGQLTDAGTYTVLVSNSANVVGSSNAVLTVNVPVCTPAPTNLVAWWQAEGDANDSVGTNNGVLEGGLNYSPGLVGQAFNFNGNNADISIPASASLNVGIGGGFTIEGWVKPTSVANEQPIAEWNSAATLYGVHFWISTVPSAGNGPGCLYANLRDTAGNSHTISSPGGLIVTNVFQHVAVTYNKTNGATTLYLNGNTIAQANLGTFTPLTSPDLYIGYRPYGGGAGERFKGLIDELSIYNRALSTAEIQSIYNSMALDKCALPPVIVSQPAPVAVVPGQTAKFAAVACGSPALSYQWQLNGGKLTNDAKFSGTTTPELTVSGISQAEVGGYTVVVSNLVDSVISAPGMLRITPRTLTVLGGHCTPGGPVLVPVQLLSDDAEHALAFSVAYDTNLLTFVSATNGPDAADAAFTVTAAAGQIGISLTRPAGSSFTNGLRTVALLNFTGAAITNSAVTAITFADAPVVRLLQTTNNLPLPAQYTAGGVVILPAISVGQSVASSLFNQVIHVTNPANAGGPVNAVRIWFYNLGVDSKGYAIRVNNATGTSNGVPFIQWNGTLAPGQSVDLAVEYYIADRKTMPQPNIVVEFPGEQTFTVPDGTVVTALFKMFGDHTLVQFDTLAGHTYYVQYAADATGAGGWKTAQPPIIGTGATVQWIDNGPPKTESAPNAVPSRFYRVLLTP